MTEEELIIKLKLAGADFRKNSPITWWRMQINGIVIRWDLPVFTDENQYTILRLDIYAPAVFRTTPQGVYDYVMPLVLP